MYTGSIPVLASSKINNLPEVKAGDFNFGGEISYKVSTILIWKINFEYHSYKFLGFV